MEFDKEESDVRLQEITEKYKEMKVRGLASFVCP